MEHSALEHLNDTVEVHVGFLAKAQSLRALPKARHFLPEPLQFLFGLNMRGPLVITFLLIPVTITQYPQPLPLPGLWQFLQLANTTFH
jgi:hypothetical protein